MSEVDELLALTQKALPSVSSPIPLHEPQFDQEEQQVVMDCLASQMVSSIGSYVDRFEQDVAAFTGVKHAVAVVNGTAALHLAYLVAGVRPGDEVLCPSLTFVATINAIAYCGATPHFIDIEEDYATVDVARCRRYLEQCTAVEKGQRINKNTGAPIRALVILHSFGHPADMQALRALCDDFGLALIEDAAEALGSYYQKQHVGHLSDVAILSFNGNKIITTGGGGILLTNNETMAKQAKHLSTTARVPDPHCHYHDQIGYNYRMPNINAALGVAQLKKMPHFLEMKRQLAQRYEEVFSAQKGLRFLTEPEYGKSNYWLNTLVFEEPVIAQDFLKATQKAGILTRQVWRAMHQLPMFAKAPRGDLAVTEVLSQRLVHLPSSAWLGEK